MAGAAQVASGIFGDKLYQQRARTALPLLVRQAEGGEPIVYEDLAAQLGMPNPRNLDYPLGSIGATLKALSGKWREEIPPLQCLVVNKTTRLPGNGIGDFLVPDFKKMPTARKRVIVRGQVLRIASYPRWREVLEALELRRPVRSCQ